MHTFWIVVLGLYLLLVGFIHLKSLKNLFVSEIAGSEIEVKSPRELRNFHVGKLLVFWPLVIFVSLVPLGEVVIALAGLANGFYRNFALAAAVVGFISVVRFFKHALSSAKDLESQVAEAVKSLADGEPSKKVSIAPTKATLWFRLLSLVGLAPFVYGVYWFLHLTGVLGL